MGEIENEILIRSALDVRTFYEPLNQRNPEIR